MATYYYFKSDIILNENSIVYCKQTKSLHIFSIPKGSCKNARLSQSLCWQMNHGKMYLVLTCWTISIQKLHNICSGNEMAHLNNHFELWGSPLLSLYCKKAYKNYSNLKGNNCIWKDDFLPPWNIIKMKSFPVLSLGKSLKPASVGSKKSQNNVSKCLPGLLWGCVKRFEDLKAVYNLIIEER